MRDGKGVSLMKAQENQRIRLSKKMLKDSLIKLLNEKCIHKVSVIEICNEAQINRTTFYKYYGSQYDLLKDMENDVLTHINDYLSANNAYSDNILQQCIKIVSFINENIDLCRILFDNNVDPKFPEKIFDLPSIKQLEMEYGENASTYIFNFVTDGGFGVIKRWISKENRESPEEIADLFNTTIMKLLPGAGSA